MDKHTLAARKINKQYGRKVAVHNISFTVDSNEIIGLLGPNGAGKTTSFYIVVGFLAPNRGEILLDDHIITNDPMHIRVKKGVSYLPQDASIFTSLTVENNIRAMLEHPSISKEEREERVEELLEMFYIRQVRRQKGFTLSGGERRRVEIARAMANRPYFLLLDEPFTGIDPLTITEIKQILIDLSNSGVGVLITDHNVRDTLDITSRSYIISSGRVVVSGDTENIVENELVRRIYLGHEFSF